MESSQILIVRHGPGRGRNPGYLDAVLEYFEQQAPDFYSRIGLHATGSPKPPDLSNVRAVLFWLGDPLRESYPECFAEAQEIVADAQARGIRSLNRPEALSNTIKTRQSEIWKSAGILTPAHTEFQTREELLELGETHSYPLIVKGNQMHAQKGMHFCRSFEELERIPHAALRFPGAVAEFIETRAGYETARPGSVWSRYYHKKRTILFGDLVHPRHVFFSDHPVVGIKTSILKSYAFSRRKNHLGWIADWRLKRHPEHQQCLAEDYAFYSAPPEAPEVMRLAARSLGLDVLGIDYSTLADGRVVLWEANPYFDLPGPRKYILPKQRHFEERFHGFYAAFREFLEGLLDERD